MFTSTTLAAATVCWSLTGAQIPYPKVAMLGMNTYEAMGVPVPREFSEDRIIVPPPCVPQALPVAQPAPREQGDEVDEL